MRAVLPSLSITDLIINTPGISTSLSFSSGTTDVQFWSHVRVESLDSDLPNALVCNILYCIVKYVVPKIVVSDTTHDSDSGN